MIGLDLLINITASVIYDKSKDFFHSRKKSVNFDKKSVSNGLNNHLHEIINWSSELRHKGMSTKNTDEHYIHLKYFSTPRRDQFEDIPENSYNIDLKYHFENTTRNTIILGQPGAGKTTSSKFIAHKIITDESFCQHRYKFPVVIRVVSFCE
jgi:DNA replication protein DnaC